MYSIYIFYNSVGSVDFQLDEIYSFLQDKPLEINPWAGYIYIYQGVCFEVYAWLYNPLLKYTMCVLSIRQQLVVAVSKLISKFSS